MNARSETQPQKNATKLERKSDRELVITRTISGPARLVFDAWTKPELLKRWWVPRSASMSLLSCEVDARTGGTYRFVFDLGNAKTMAFFGKYIEVAPPSRLVWTNEEEADGAVTTATFTEQGDQTVVTLSELYPTKEALENAMTSGAPGAMPETFEQLEELIVSLSR
jgi:uncharacterized protein YndB with AHSA1/START domain